MHTQKPLKVPCHIEILINGKLVYQNKVSFPDLMKFWDHKKIVQPHKKKNNNFMAPFYGWSSTASRLEPLRGGSLLFTTKFPEIRTTPYNLIKMYLWLSNFEKYFIQSYLCFQSASFSAIGKSIKS